MGKDMFLFRFCASKRMYLLIYNEAVISQSQTGPAFWITKNVVNKELSAYNLLRPSREIQIKVENQY